MKNSWLVLPVTSNDEIRLQSLCPSLNLLQLELIRCFQSVFWASRKPRLHVKQKLRKFLFYSLYCPPSLCLSFGYALGRIILRYGGECQRIKDLNSLFISLDLVQLIRVCTVNANIDVLVARTQSMQNGLPPKQRISYA